MRNQESITLQRSKNDLRAQSRLFIAVVTSCVAAKVLKDSGAAHSAFNIVFPGGTGNTWHISV